jgi:hypothetical protein
MAKQKKPKPPKATAQKRAPQTLEALATGEDARTVFDQIKAAETKYAKAKTDATAAKAKAKQALDKTYTDGAAMLISRGMTQRDLKAEYLTSLRDEDEAVVSARARTWFGRAVGIAGAMQLSFFDEPVKGAKDALARAYKFGRDIGARGGSQAEIDGHFHPGTQPGQEALKGWADAQAALTPGAKNVTNLADAKKAKAKAVAKAKKDEAKAKADRDDADDDKSGSGYEFAAE